MKSKKLQLSILTFALIMCATSCKKDNNNTTPPTASTPQVATPSDADGFFVAVNTITTQEIPFIGTQTFEIGTAAAGFFQSTGNTSNFKDGGTLSVKDSILTKQSNNSYVFQPSQSNIEGINHTSSSRWQCAGNSANNIQPFTYVHNANMPDLGLLTSSKDVQTGSDYTVSTNKAWYADSVIFIISGPNGSVVKVKPTNTTSCTFTASELGTLGKGDNSGLVQIAPYTISGTTINGKKYYFIKETVLSTFVNLK